MDSPNKDEVQNTGKQRNPGNKHNPKTKIQQDTMAHKYSTNTAGPWNGSRTENKGRVRTQGRAT